MIQIFRGEVAYLNLMQFAMKAVTHAKNMMVLILKFLNIFAYHVNQIIIL